MRTRREEEEEVAEKKAVKYETVICILHTKKYNAPNIRRIAFFG